MRTLEPTPAQAEDSGLPIFTVPGVRLWVMLGVGIVTGLIAAAIAFGVSSVLPKSWETQAIVLIEPAVISNIQDVNLAQQLAFIYAGRAATAEALEPVIQRLELDETVSQLKERITVRAPEGLSSIDIVASDRSATGAAALANAIADEIVKLATREQPIAEPSPAPATASPNPSEGPSASQSPSAAPSPASSGNVIRATIVEQAPEPNSPSSPRIPINTLLGGVLGFVLGIGIAWLFTTRPGEI